VKKLSLLLLSCTIFFGCAGCKEEVKGAVGTKTETTKQYVYEYRYFWLKGGMRMQGNGYIASSLHDSARPVLRAGISRIERAMGGMIKFVEVQDYLQADFFVGGTHLQQRSVLAFWDPAAKIICLNTNTSGGANAGVTMAHELCHMLGLPHSDDKNSIMFWQAGGSAIFTKKDRDDIKAILEGKSL